MLVHSLALAAALALLALPASAQTLPDWSKAKTVTVSLSNYAFTPSTLNLRVGQPYHLIFASTVTKDHDFSAPQLFKSGIVADGDKSKISEDGEVEVDEGSTVTVDFAPEKAGIYPFECTHFMHSMMGMHGQAIVQ
jgi:plastocyanin